MVRKTIDLDACGQARIAVDPVMLEKLVTSGAPAHVLYAYQKTGLIVTADNSAATSLADRAFWDAALREFEAIEWEASLRPPH